MRAWVSVLRGAPVSRRNGLAYSKRMCFFCIWLSGRSLLLNFSSRLLFDGLFKKPHLPFSYSVDYLI